MYVHTMPDNSTVASNEGGGEMGMEEEGKGRGGGGGV